MIYFLYVLLVPISLFVTLIGLLLSPILPLFASSAYGYSDNGSKLAFEPRLPVWLSWFQTPDNSLMGDAAFIFANGIGYLAEVKWLIRNPAYAFSIRYLTPPYNATFLGDNTIKDNDHAKSGWLFVRAGGIFQFACVCRIASTSRCFYINLGWNIRALVDDNINPKPNPYQATFVFSPRISGFK